MKTDDKSNSESWWPAVKSGINFLFTILASVGLAVYALQGDVQMATFFGVLLLLIKD